ncbi:MAG: DUF4926 domain-containing protein [Pseudanabaena sp. CAN_BIN31]|nr:DUF4926 domain-containing protein [Pseudanabaena sp. CAN_BIN31]
MTKFQMFDSVTLNQDIQLSRGETAPRGTDGAIVEIFKDGEAYLVELFDGWLKFNPEGDIVETAQDDSEAFRDTLEVEVVYPYQLDLVVKEHTAEQTAKIQLFTLINSLSGDKILQIGEFAEFLYQRQTGLVTTPKS